MPVNQPAQRIDRIRNPVLMKIAVYSTAAYGIPVIAKKFFPIENSDIHGCITAITVNTTAVSVIRDIKVMLSNPDRGEYPDRIFVISDMSFKCPLNNKKSMMQIERTLMSDPFETISCALMPIIFFINNFIPYAIIMAIKHAKIFILSIINRAERIQRDASAASPD